ncbi:transferase, partial [Campylobacter coli CVM 41904]
NEDNFDKKLIQKASFALGVGQINLRKKILVKLSKKNHVILSLLYILNLLFQKKLK